MKFTCVVEVNRPVGEVAALFCNPETLGEWQDGFVSILPVSGTPGEVSAKSKINLNSGGHAMELMETVISRNWPHEISRLYEHKHMVNTMTNRFSPLDGNRTRIETEIEYTQFIGVIPKLMAALMPGVFRRQTQKWLESFKVFAEKA